MLEDLFSMVKVRFNADQTEDDKKKTDIPKGSSPQQRVHNGVHQDVGVRMAQKTFFIRNLHSAQNELSALHQLMDIISCSYTHLKSPV